MIIKQYSIELRMEAESNEDYKILVALSCYLDAPIKYHAIDEKYRIDINEIFFLQKCIDKKKELDG